MNTDFEEIRSFDFSTRVQNVLSQMNVTNLRELASFTENDLYRLPNLGKKSVTEIRQTLSNHGLHLGMCFEDKPPEQSERATASVRSVDAWIHYFAAKRVAFLEKASLARCATADNHLGRLYLEGVGVPPDYQKARRYFIRAARRGCRLGYWNLALIYSIGYGVRRSQVKANRLLRRYEREAIPNLGIFML